MDFPRVHCTRLRLDHCYSLMLLCKSLFTLNPPLPKQMKESLQSPKQRTFRVTCSEKIKSNKHMGLLVILSRCLIPHSSWQVADQASGRGAAEDCRVKFCRQMACACAPSFSCAARFLERKIRAQGCSSRGKWSSKTLSASMIVGGG